VGQHASYVFPVNHESIALLHLLVYFLSRPAGYDEGSDPQRDQGHYTNRVQCGCLRFCLGKGINMPPWMALQSRSIRLVHLSNMTKNTGNKKKVDEERKGHPGPNGFKPADQELINFFLYRKVVLRQPLLPRHVGFVHEIDFLGDHQPWEIWDACGGPHTPTAKKYTSSASSRNYQNPAYACVLRILERQITRRRPDYRSKKTAYVHEGSEHHHNWYLETYTLASIPDDDQPVAAICLLRKHYHKRKR
ncbi:hypothetical protein DVH24_002617, partial [Malus domestica]